MANWFPLHCHSDASLLDGLSKPDQIAARLLECGYAGSAITDHGTASGVPNFIKTLTKKKLKPIAGLEFYLPEMDATIKGEENRSLHHLVVLAKGERGWKNLIQATSASYRPEFSYHKPRLDLERLGAFGKGEFIAFSGHMGSNLANVCFAEPKLAYDANTYEEARTLVHPDWKNRVKTAVRRHQQAFGKENFYLEIQLVDHKRLPASLVVARILRAVGRELGVARVATADSHYCRHEDAADQRILLCRALKTTMKEVQRKIESDDDAALGGFFKSNNYHIPSPEEINELHGDCPDELATSLEIAGRCEPFVVGGKPLLPAFKCPNGISPDAHLENLCRDGWEKRIRKKVPKETWPEYEARLWEEEFPVVKSTEGFLASYFLIKEDIIRYARNTLKVKTGLGRGSAAGCLISYATGITRLDPIRFKLSFSRFYNSGRNSPGHIALPDIDSDFPIAAREKIVQYCRDTYGHDKVSQMATFSRMQGRGAMKDVLWAHDRCSFEETNRITENIPDESEIADQLQEMREETGEASIIRWALENTPDQLREWAFLNDAGEIDGPLAIDFMQAIRLEGTKKGMGKHASGLIISSQPLADICPMVWDKSEEEMMVGVDMKDSELLGLVKFDLLGLRCLDCIADTESIIRTGRA